MVFDPDNANAHADRAAHFGEPEDPKRRGERPSTVARRGPASDVERWAADALSVLAADGHQDLPDAVRSIGGQVLAYGPRLSEKQWAYAVSLAERFQKRHALPRPSPPAPRSPLEQEASEVEAQLDDLLRLDVDKGGARCLQAVEEMEGRRGRLDATLAALADGDAARYAAARPVGFGCCGSCVLAPSTACPRCARGEAHPGEACRGADGSESARNRVCRGLAYLAHLRARILEAAGRGDDAREVRADMGLEVKLASPRPTDPSLSAREVRS